MKDTIATENSDTHGQWAWGALSLIVGYDHRQSPFAYDTVPIAVTGTGHLVLRESPSRSLASLHARFTGLLSGITRGVALL